MAQSTPPRRYVGITSPAPAEGVTNSYRAIVHTLPLPTTWDGLVAARQDMVVAAMAEHRALTTVRGRQIAFGLGDISAAILEDAMDDLGRARTHMEHRRLAEEASLDRWTMEIDTAIVGALDWADNPAYEEAENLRAARDIEERAARGEPS